MKILFGKIFYIFVFIILSVCSTFASDFGIDSVTYDDSNNFISINSMSIEDFNFSGIKLYIV